MIIALINSGYFPAKMTLFCHIHLCHSTCFLLLIVVFALLPRSPKEHSAYSLFLSNFVFLCYWQFAIFCCCLLSSVSQFRCLLSLVPSSSLAWSQKYSTLSHPNSISNEFILLINYSPHECGIRRRVVATKFLFWGSKPSDLRFWIMWT